MGISDDSNMPFAKVYENLLYRILMYGTRSNPRNMPILELLGESITIPNALECILVNHARDLNYRFALAEALWIVEGREDLESIAKFNKEYIKFSDDGIIMAGAYGPRLKGSFSYIINKLMEDNDSRQAVIAIWSNNPRPSKDIPCTISVQFLVREEKLYSIWNMRSSDAWLGLPYDVFSFGVYTGMIATCLHCDVGSMQLNLGSSHLYIEHHLQAQNAIDAFEGIETLKLPPIGKCLPMLYEIRDTAKTKKECLDRLRILCQGESK